MQNSLCRKRWAGDHLRKFPLATGSRARRARRACRAQLTKSLERDQCAWSLCRNPPARVSTGGVVHRKTTSGVELKVWSLFSGSYVLWKTLEATIAHAHARRQTMTQTQAFLHLQLHFHSIQGPGTERAWFERQERLQMLPLCVQTSGSILHLAVMLGSCNCLDFKLQSCAHKRRYKGCVCAKHVFFRIITSFTISPNHHK